MAFTAFTKNFQVISITQEIKPESGMTGLAHASGRQMIGGFICNRWILAIVTGHTIRCVSCMDA